MIIIDYTWSAIMTAAKARPSHSPPRPHLTEPEALTLEPSRATWHPPARWRHRRDFNRFQWKLEWDVIGFQVFSSSFKHRQRRQKKTNRFPHKTVVLRSPAGKMSEKRYPLATKHSNGNHRGRKSCALEPAPSLNQPKKWALWTWCMRALQLYNGHASSSCINCIKKNSSKSRSWYVLLPFGPRSPKEIGCFSHVEPAPLRLLKMAAKEPEILLPRHPTQHSLSSIPFENIWIWLNMWWGRKWCGPRSTCTVPNSSALTWYDTKRQNRTLTSLNMSESARFLYDAFEKRQINSATRRALSVHNFCGLIILYITKYLHAIFKSSVDRCPPRHRCRNIHAQQWPQVDAVDAKKVGIKIHLSAGIDTHGYPGIPRLP